jgi:hypothetical protein
VHFFLELDDQLGLVQAVLERRHVPLQFLDLLPFSSAFEDLRPSTLGRQSRKAAGIPLLAPMSLVRRVEPFPTQQRADGAWLAGVDLAKDLVLVLGREGPSARSFDRLVRSALAGFGRPDVGLASTTR